MAQQITEFDWEHVKTGARYRILLLAVEEATLTPVVVYRCTTSGAVWTRPVAEFFDGRFLDTRTHVASGSELEALIKARACGDISREAFVDELRRRGVLAAASD